MAEQYPPLPGTDANRICPLCESITQDWICADDGTETLCIPGSNEQGDPWLGQCIAGRYQVDEVLAEGGMCVIYRATHLSSQRAVALKLLRPAYCHHPAVVARFQQEGRTAASLRHRNTVRILDFGQTDEQVQFLVMELLEGRSLADCLDAEKRLEPGRVIRIIIQLLEALTEAHDAGVVHRDLKPENIFLTGSGVEEQVKLLDFGVAHVALPSASGRALTAPGTTVGSPPYVSPEQAMGQWVDGQSDIYSVGVLAYEMLSGRRPFECDSATEYLMAHVRRKPGRPRIDGHRLSGPLVSFIMRSLAKDPERRPDGVRSALIQLHACGERPVVFEGSASTRSLSRSLKGRPGTSSRLRSSRATTRQIDVITGSHQVTAPGAQEGGTEETVAVGSAGRRSWWMGGLRRSLVLGVGILGVFFALNRVAPEELSRRSGPIAVSLVTPDDRAATTRRSVGSQTLGASAGRVGTVGLDSVRRGRPSVPGALAAKPDVPREWAREPREPRRLVVLAIEAQEAMTAGDHERARRLAVDILAIDSKHVLGQQIMRGMNARQGTPVPATEALQRRAFHSVRSGQVTQRAEDLRGADGLSRIGASVKERTPAVKVPGRELAHEFRAR